MDHQATLRYRRCIKRQRISFTMDFAGFVMPAVLALLIGGLAARRFPVLGLVAVLGLVLLLAVLRVGLGFSHPTVLETVLLVALMQAGYLASALLPQIKRAKPVAQRRSLREDRPAE